MNTWSSQASIEGVAIRRFYLRVAKFFRRPNGGVLAIALCLCVSLLPMTDANAGDQSRPMGITCNTTFAFTGVGVIHLEGTCYLLHLGLTSVVATQIVIPQQDGTLLITTVIVYTAANGDELFSSFVGIGNFTPTGVSFSGTETYNSGTGRFGDASGSAALVGIAQFTSAAGGVGEFSGEGNISY